MTEITLTMSKAEAEILGFALAVALRMQRRAAEDPTRSESNRQGCARTASQINDLCLRLEQALRTG